MKRERPRRNNNDGRPASVASTAGCTGIHRAQRIFQRVMGNVRYLSLNDGIDEAVVTNQNDCGAEEYTELIKVDAVLPRASEPHL
uniref:Uncharacterized protein n=1 Tax=Vespula pensylvanica TaxID=30213 RepID=A0A834NZ27_VESPE|nr:hypothetical protein H0235_009581 [Vespula pensylvanica]